MLFLFTLTNPAHTTSLEPLYEKHVKGVPLTGSWQHPIGPGTDEGLYNDLFEGDILYGPVRQFNIRAFEYVSTMKLVEEKFERIF